MVCRHIVARASNTCHHFPAIDVILPQHPQASTHVSPGDPSRVTPTSVSVFLPEAAMHRFMSSLTFVFGFAPALAAQQPAMSEHERIELLAATQVAPYLLKSFRQSLVLDSRTYSASPNSRASHAAAHVKALAVALSAKSIVTDSPDCQSSKPKPCRLGDALVLVSVRPAEINQDTARVIVDFWQRPSRRETDQSSLTQGDLTVRLIKTEGNWRVTGPVLTSVP